MDVATITMDPAVAKEKLEVYRDLLASRVGSAQAREEYQRAAHAYAQLAEGTPLISLTEAIQGAPVDARGRPRLGVARADRNQVHFRFWDTSGPVASVHYSTLSARSTRSGVDLAITVPLGRPYPTEARDPRYPNYTSAADGYSLVPMVPPEVLLDLRLDGRTVELRQYLILWEVVQWADQRIGVKPDVDPYLLKRIADDLFAVVGEWDLTDVERAIMRDRRDA